MNALTRQRTQALLKGIASNLVHILFDREVVVKDRDLFEQAMEGIRDNLLAIATNTAPVQGPKLDLRTTIRECLDATFLAEEKLEGNEGTIESLRQIQMSLEEVRSGISVA